MQLKYEQRVWIDISPRKIHKWPIKIWKDAQHHQSFSSVQSLSRVQLFSTHESQHARPPCPSPTPGVHSDSCPSSQWCHPAISSSVVPFSSCPQFLPASESFPMSQLFTWGDQSTGVSALAAFLAKDTQDWSPLEWTGWISLQSKGLSRVFSNLPCSYLQIFICRNVSLSSTRKRRTLNNSYQ